MSARTTRSAEGGFTLIEVLIATALFVFVAFAGFEAVRTIGTQVQLLAQRSNAASQLAAATASMRSDALSSAAVWKPASRCGDGVAFMQKLAGNATSFSIYVTRPQTTAGETRFALLHATSATGPLDPCDPALTTGVILASIAGLHVGTLTASSLPGHADAVSGHADGAIFRAGGIAAIAVDSHDRDYDGSPILSGNSVTEVSIDADPAQVTLDLVAGNRPSGFTNVLAYDCGARCRATALFPETRGVNVTRCTVTYDLPDSVAGYVPAVGQPMYIPASGGRLQPVIAAYAVSLGVIFAFDGTSGHAQEKLFVSAPAWSLPGMQDAPAIAADGSVVANYAANSVKRSGAAKLFADAGGAITLAPQLALCAAMNAESNDFDG